MGTCASVTRWSGTAVWNEGARGQWEVRHVRDKKGCFPWIREQDLDALAGFSVSSHKAVGHLAIVTCLPMLLVQNPEK